MGFKISGATIVDQDRQLLNVGGINASAGIVTITDTLKVGTGITAHAGIITATAYYGDGTNLTGVDATSLKDGSGTVRVQANPAGAVVTGILTATTIKGLGASDAIFIGDGSGLSGVTGTGSGVVIRHDNTLVGTAATIDFSTNLDVTAVSAGICTITASGGSSVDMLEIMLFA